MKQTVLIVIAVVAVLGIVYFVAQRADAPSSSIDTNESDGEVENEQTGELVEHELIRVTSPLPSETVTSPLTVTGEARGMWYFEATFPIVMVDWDGLIIAEGYAEAQGEWMTEEFVPFVGTLTFTKPEYGERGAIILQKSNPSGLPENDDAVEVPILFE